jgi:uncharacterized membrane protein
VRVVRTALLLLMAVFYVGAGVSHFTQPAFYEEIVPPFLPAPRLLVWVSGVAEILLGLLVLVPATRRVAAWGIVGLLVAVAPANVYMAVADLQLQHAPEWMGQPSQAALWLRLPVQVLLIAWAWWYTRPAPAAPV